VSKAADAFRTISEVADDLDVPKHVLRFWENRFPQIRPMKRGGGRRYYRPEDLDLLRGIKHLLHSDGYTIKGVQKILRESGVDAVKSSTRASHEPANSIAKPRGATAKGRKASAKVSPADQRTAIITKAIEELMACRAILAPDVLTAAKSARLPARPKA
jgi:DNA-binding transcriptional MerR regulator